MRAFLPALLLLSLPAVAQAQPARIGNIYNGTAHQPNADVQNDEAAAGVRQSPSAEKAENEKLDAIGKQLLEKSRRDAARQPAYSNLYHSNPPGVVQTAPNSRIGEGRVQ